MKKPKLFFGLAVIFLSGVVIGVAGTGLYVKHKIRSVIDGGPRAARELVLERLDHVLDLDDEQRPEIDKIVRGAQHEIRQLRLRDQPEIDQIFADSVRKMKTKLSPQQQEELQQRYEKLLDRWRIKDNGMAEAD
jgi:hypothetical protein